MLKILHILEVNGLLKPVNQKRGDFYVASMDLKLDPAYLPCRVALFGQHGDL